MSDKDESITFTVENSGTEEKKSLTEQILEMQRESKEALKRAREVNEGMRRQAQRDQQKRFDGVLAGDSYDMERVRARSRKSGWLAPSYPLNPAYLG